MINDKLLEFVKFTRLFGTIKRSILIDKDTRNENDMEHSYQLAMVGWYIVNSKNLPLDTNILVKYALVHDLVEAYADDTCAFLDSSQFVESKEQREHDAFEKMKVSFAEFKEMLELIEKYEEKYDEESKFIYALDKFLALLNIYTEESKLHLEHKVTFEKWYELKGKKIVASKYVDDIYKSMEDILKEDKLLFFH